MHFITVHDSSIPHQSIHIASCIPPPLPTVLLFLPPLTFIASSSAGRDTSLSRLHWRAVSQMVAQICSARPLSLMPW